MTSEQYIIRLLQTIESLDSTMKAMREETAFLREQLSRMSTSLTESELERKRLLALIEAKDEDHRKMSKQVAQLLAKVDSLTKAHEDKPQINSES